MQSDLQQVLASVLKGYLSQRLNAPSGAFESTCSAVSYERDRTFVRSLDDRPRYMDSENARAITLLRQTFKWVYKLRAESSEVQNEEAVRSFVSRNCTAGAWRLPIVQSERWPESRLTRVFLLAQQLVQSVTRTYSLGQPCHGPGTTFFGYDELLAKYAYLERDVSVRTWRRFKSMFKPSEGSEYIEPLLVERSLCRLSAVPKDSRGPRLVAPHMASAIWVQQAILDGIQKTVLTHPLFLGTWPGSDQICTVQLRDQTVNQRVAAYASSNPEMYATLDLKDASDLVSWRLVCFLFKGTTLLRDLYAVRATHVKLPGGQVEKLHMHAPMGSAVCFPIMAISLWSLATAAGWVMDHEYARFRPVSKSLWADNKPFVFGDDVIIPTRHYNAVKTVFERAGLVLNNQKCFFGAGGFRESCGCDYYRGHLVTPMLLRRLDIGTLEGSASFMRLANRLISDGQEDLGEVIIRRLIEARKVHISGASSVAYSSDPHSPVLHYPITSHVIRANRKLGCRVRYNVGLQRYEVLVRTNLVVEEECRNQRLDSRARLYEALAASHHRENSVGDKPGPLANSFGWARKRSRARNVWIAC